MKKLLYFGCVRHVGHYLFADEFNHVYDEEKLEELTGIKDVPHEIFASIDGKHTPKSSKNQGDAAVMDLPPFKVIAWHDYTIDSRGNSNSALLGYEYDSREEMLADAAKVFPGVMKRQPGPLNFIDE